MDIKLVQKVIYLLQDYPHISELEIKNLLGFSKILIRRSSSFSSKNQAPQIEGTQVVTSTKRVVYITSPKVGRFLTTNDPEQNYPLIVGNTIVKGEIIYFIEALGMQYAIESEVAGIVSEVLIETGQPVEYDQKLFLITESDSSEQ